MTILKLILLKVFYKLPRKIFNLSISIKKLLNWQDTIWIKSPEKLKTTKIIISESLSTDKHGSCCKTQILILCSISYS